MSVTPNTMQVSPNAGGASSAAAGGASWVTLDYADATFADPNDIIDTWDSVTGAFTTNANAGSFENSTQPATWTWEIEAGCETHLGLEAFLTGHSFENNAGTGIGVAITDSATTSTGTGLIIAHTSITAAYRVAAGRYGQALNDQNPGIDGDTLRGRFVFACTTGGDQLANPNAWLEDSDGEAGNGNNAANSSKVTPTFSPSGTLLLVLAVQQDATIRSGNLGTLSYHLIPRPS